MWNVNKIGQKVLESFYNHLAIRPCASTLFDPSRIGSHPDYIGVPETTAGYPAPTLFRGRYRPDTADKVALDDKGRYAGTAVRLTLVSPEELLEKKTGFTGKGASLNFQAHLKGGPERLGQSAFVSSAKSIMYQQLLLLMYMRMERMGGRSLYNYHVRLEPHNSFMMKNFANTQTILDHTEIVSTKIELNRIDAVDILRLPSDKEKMRLQATRVFFPFKPETDLCTYSQDVTDEYREVVEGETLSSWRGLHSTAFDEVMSDVGRTTFRRI